MINDSIRETLIAGIKKNRFLYLDYGRYGLIVEPMKDKEIDYVNKKLCFFVSVPASSDLKNEYGQEIAGETLAKAYADKVRDRFAQDVYDLQVAANIEPHKDLIAETVQDVIKVKFKIRDNEHWTREKEELATVLIMSALMDKQNNV